MKSKEFKPALFIKKESLLSLSGPALSELLQAILYKGVPFRFRAKGFSMSPFIKNDDIITVSPLRGAKPGFGDVVAFIRPGTGKLVVHRVVGKRSDSYIIKGDSTPEIDGLVQKEKILGRLTKIERGGKEVFLGLGQERFLIALFTRNRLLFSLLLPVWRLIHSIIRGLAK